MERFGGTIKAAAGATAKATVKPDNGIYFRVVFAGGSQLDGKAAFGRVVVNGPKSSVPPSGSATVVALDYSFRATGLRAGVNRVAFRNDGKERHYVLMFRMKSGKTIETYARKWHPTCKARRKRLKKPAVRNSRSSAAESPCRPTSP